MSIEEGGIEMTMRGVEISQATHREWRLPAITSDLVVGAKLKGFFDVQSKSNVSYRANGRCNRNNGG